MKIYQYPSSAAQERLDAIIHRGIEHNPDDVARVAQIISDVKDEGDEALVRYTRQFDSDALTVADIRVPPSQIAAAADIPDEGFLRALDRSARQIEAFHRAQVERSWIQSDRPGTLLGQLVHPVDAAGVYVPGGQGGRTPLVSSVLMGIIPAKIAGVQNVCMVTPPQADGTVNPYLLAAAHRAGADAVYRVGGAWSIAALAHGTETIPRVDVIVGPGNIYVTLAKKLVSSFVGIDMIAGPSEILIIADETATPAFVAADLLSQAEHDVLASSVLLTPSRMQADAVAEAVKSQLGGLMRRDIAQRSLDRYGAIIVVPDLDTAFTLSNRIAPEHLELQIREPFETVDRIRNAGAVFLGPHTPEPVGDYMAGPNHVLPTAGTARFSSALSVSHFTKKTSLVRYAESTFRQEAGDIIRLAEIEGLDAHANAVKIRLTS
jgi:histidinol dehydrogenase